MALSEIGLALCIQWTHRCLTQDCIVTCFQLTLAGETCRATGMAGGAFPSGLPSYIHMEKIPHMQWGRMETQEALQSVCVCACVCMPVRVRVRVCVHVQALDLNTP